MKTKLLLKIKTYLTSIWGFCFIYIFPLGFSVIFKLTYTQFYILINIKYNLKLKLVTCVMRVVRGLLVACVVFPSIQMTTSTMTLKVSRHLILSGVVVCRPWSLLSYFCLFALLLLKFALTIQNFRIVLSFTDISVLIFIFFLIFVLGSFIKF